MGVGADQPLFSPVAQDSQAQEAGAQEEHGGGQRDGGWRWHPGVISKEPAKARRKGVIQAGKTGVQGRNVIEKNRVS